MRCISNINVCLCRAEGEVRSKWNLLGPNTLSSSVREPRCFQRESTTLLHHGSPQTRGLHAIPAQYLELFRGAVVKLKLYIRTNLIKHQQRFHAREQTGFAPLNAQNRGVLKQPTLKMKDRGETFAPHGEQGTQTSPRGE